MTVSRQQLVVALTGLLALDGQDAMAAELLHALPEQDTHSAAQARHADIQAVVDAAGAKHHAAGVQVAVIENGVVTDTFNYGWATKNTDPMTSQQKCGWPPSPR